MAAESWHGTVGGYTNHACRCEPCRQALRDYQRERRRARLAGPTPERVHGTANGYGNYGCRCERCTAAWAENERAVRAKRAGRD